MVPRAELRQAGRREVAMRLVNVAQERQKIRWFLCKGFLIRRQEHRATTQTLLAALCPHHANTRDTNPALQYPPHLLI